jgi:hypothetical protein
VETTKEKRLEDPLRLHVKYIISKEKNNMTHLTLKLSKTC